MKSTFLKIIDFLNKNIKNNILKHCIGGLPFTLITYLLVNSSVSVFVGLAAGAVWEYYFKSKHNDQIKDILATGSSSLIWVAIDLLIN